MDSRTEHKLLTHITTAMAELTEASLMIEWELEKPKPFTSECMYCKELKTTCKLCLSYHDAINHIADAQSSIRRSFELEQLIIRD